MKNVLLLAIVTAGLMVGSYVESHYTTEAVVTEINSCKVTVKDCRGEWNFYGDGYEVGQEVKLVFDTNHTDGNIFDDTIVKVK